MQMHHVRRGSGKPLLLVPGLGATWRSWDTIADALAREREVIAIDLPGFGATPPLSGEVSIATRTDAVVAFGHFPPWDVPQATIRLVLDSTA